MDNEYGQCAHHRPKQNLVGDLPVEPDILISGEQPSQFGPDNTDDIAQHGDQDHGTIESQDETRSTRRPDREAQGIESSQPSISFLAKDELGHENEAQDEHTWLHHP
jgi:hypothetical protein